MTAEPLPPAPASGDASLEPPPEPPRPTLPELLSAIHDLANAEPELQIAAARLLAGDAPDPDRRLRVVGRARKVSVSMPEDLTAAVRQRVGRGEFSQYVSDAVARQLDSDLLGEVLAYLDAEYGPVTEEELAEARKLWPDAS